MPSPFGVRLLILAPEMLPVVLRAKSFGILTPVTASLKVTRKSTLVALVVVASGFKRVMDATKGAVVSMVRLKVLETDETLPAASDALAVMS